MLILYKREKKNEPNCAPIYWNTAFLRVLDSFGQLRGFGQDGLNLSKRGGFYHFVQNLPTLPESDSSIKIPVFEATTNQILQNDFTSTR